MAQRNKIKLYKSTLRIQIYELPDKEFKVTVINKSAQRAKREMTKLIRKVKHEQNHINKEKLLKRSKFWS